MAMVITKLQEGSKKVIIFYKLIERVYKCPLRALGQRVPRIAYLKKIESFILEGYDIDESILMVKDILKEDYYRGFIKYYQYYQIGKFLDRLLEEYRKMTLENEGCPDFEKLLLKFLLALVKNDVPTTIRASLVSEWLGIDLETANKFLQWLKNSSYDIITKMVLKGKSLKKMSRTTSRGYSESE